MGVIMSTSTKQEGATEKRRPPNAGKGRPKGSPNKTTQALKDAILRAAEDVGEDGDGKGGTVGYLTTLAKTEPKAFAGLLGKVLPMTVQGPGDGGEFVFTTIERRIVKSGS